MWHVIELILAVLVLAAGFVALVLAGPPRSRNAAFWAGVGVALGAVLALVVIIRQIT